MNRASRLTGADGIRAIACLMVMAHHAFQRLAPWPLPAGSQELQLFFLTGAAGVGVFFVLSGFLLSEPFWRAWADGDERPSLRTFAVRRWARIAPAFWLNLVLVFGLSLVLVPNVPNSLLRFLAGMTFTSSLSWQTFFPVDINLPLWSIGYEVFSYAMLAASVFIWFRLPIRKTLLRGLVYWVLVLAAVLILHSLLLVVGQTDAAGKGWEYGPYGGAKYWWPDYNPIGFFAIFIVGILAAGISTAMGRWLSNLYDPALWPFDILVVGALCVAFLMLWDVRAEPDFGFSFPTMLEFFPYFPVVVGAILALSPHTQTVGKLLDNRTFRFIATISYGLYIWHYALLELARLTLWPDFGTYGVMDAMDWFLRIVGVYALAFLLATLSWYLFEKRIVAWSRDLGRRRTSPPPDGTSRTPVPGVGVANS
jgi:peptidoglycan/LPS O-acetylase OafA/YrhL